MRNDQHPVLNEIAEQFRVDVHKAASRELNNLDDGFSAKLASRGDLFASIYEHCGGSFRRGCGSYLFDGQTYSYCPLMYHKQRLFYQEALPPKTSSLLEIGVYMGHSLLLALLANPEMRITCIDNSDEFAKPAVACLRTAFPNARIHFIHADSVAGLTELESQQFDLVHIDGSHKMEKVEEELQLVQTRFGAKRIVFDDQWSVRPIISRLLISDKLIEYRRPLSAWPNAYLEFAL
jgi:hypothetical protein